jgi:mono/diheme cytochrome c family protein
MLSWRSVTRLPVFLFILPLLACDQAPSADSLPEWKPSDHHSTEELQGGGTSGQQASAGKGGEVAQLVELAWRQQCTQCHGPFGKGDGPQGPMLHAHDLSDPEWQGKVSDQDIAATIRNGKNKMPKYDLPDPVMQGLVARIRQMKGG